MSAESDRRTARRNRQAAAALVAALVEGGVEAAVVSPGSRNTPLMLAFAEHGGVEVRAVLDERVAGFYALGLARASGRPVALACTSGSAGAHYLPALIEAERSRVPLVVLTADRPPALHGCGAPQTLDQTRIFGAFAKRSRTLPPPDDDTPRRALRGAAADAVACARACPAGPVHLNVQLREPLWMAGLPDDPPRPSIVEPRPPALRAPDPTAVARFEDRAKAAERGVIVCGPDAAPGRETARAIIALGRRLGWPVLAEAASGVRFAVDGDGGRPQTIASYDALLRGPFGAVGPDCVLRFGRASTSKPLTRWLARHAVDRLVAVDPAGERHDPDHLAAQIIEADARLLADAIGGPGRAGGWRARWIAADAVARGALRAACAEGWWSGAIVHRLLAALPYDAALHAASSMPIRDLDGFGDPALLGAGCPPVYASRGANGIDGTIATALGEARGRGPAPLALLIGDLATLHDVGGLLLAGQIEPMGPVAIVVVDNGGGGIFEYLPVAEHPARFEELFLTPQPAALEPLCAAAGVGYRAVEHGEALTAALTASLTRRGVTVVHARIDRRADVARHRAAWAAVGEAVSAIDGGAR